MDGAPGGAGSLRGVKVLVIGAGAREHALCRALATDADVTALACAPGNAGTALIGAIPGISAAADLETMRDEWER